MRAVSDLDLERFLCDDLDEADRVRVAGAVDADDVLKAHVAERRAAQGAFRQRRPSLTATTTPETRSAPPGVWARLRGALLSSIAAPSLAAAAACAVLFVVVDGAEPSQGSGLRARGTETAQLVVKRGDQIFRHTQQPLRAGDAVRIRLAEKTDNANLLMVSIASVDVHGTVATLLDNVGVDEDGYVQGSLLLDDSEGAERWVVVGALEPVDVGRLSRAAHTVASHHDGEAIDLGALEKSLGAVTLSVLSFEKEPVTP